MVDKQILLDFGIRHSFPIFLFNHNFKKAIHYSSGFLYFDQNLQSSLLLSVAHLFASFKEPRNAGVFCGIKNGIYQFNRTPLVSIYHFSDLVKEKLSCELIDVSFRVSKNDETIYNVKYNPEDNSEIEMVGCEPFTVLGEANIGETYYFFGPISPQEHLNSDTKICSFKHCFEKIGYIKDEGFNQFFELENYGCFSSDAYKGCSGAPIFNKQGELISMLTGHEDNCVLKGINLQKVLPVVEQFLSAFSPIID